MIEIWKPVPCQPNLFASSWGRLKTVRGNKPTWGQWDGNRYIYSRRGYTTTKVARLICEAFNGPPQPGQVCMHLDEDSRNNRPDNLRWGTQKENLNFPGFLNYCHSRTSDESPVRKGNNAKGI